MLDSADGPHAAEHQFAKGGLSGSILTTAPGSTAGGSRRMPCPATFSVNQLTRSVDTWGFPGVETAPTYWTPFAMP